MHRQILLFALASVSLVAACSGSEDEAKSGADISITAKDADTGSVDIKADGATGKVSVKVPGFDANLSLPKMDLGAGSFDLDGVELYPGSRVSGVNVAADSSGAGDHAVVRIKFTSPAEIAKVRGWYVKGFADKGVKATPTSTGFAGTVDGDSRFTLTLVPNGTNETSGSVEIVDGKTGGDPKTSPMPPKPPSPPSRPAP